MRLKIQEAVIVEGKYDKIKLSSLIDGLIIETNGFQIFERSGTDGDDTASGRDTWDFGVDRQRRGRVCNSQLSGGSNPSRTDQARLCTGYFWERKAQREALKRGKARR
ncbi:hypothetical protein [Anaeromassilibacillus sp. SJQ-1]|uniref:hypothetical protein n=1 Tax=Anaeromassilibacillus sp. SJQ-1 TaxID=3375419 RepID=UPI003989ED01